MLRSVLAGNGLIESNHLRVDAEKSKTFAPLNGAISGLQQEMLDRKVSFCRDSEVLQC
jgi:hypothetical protein